MKIRHYYWLTVLLGCGGVPAQDAAGFASPVCRLDFAGVRLPSELQETSGLVESRTNEGVFWTHNDGRSPTLYAVRSDSTIAARVHVAGVELRDWEDIAAGPCGSGSCLYLGDIGDNGGRRTDIRIYEVPEPELDARSVAATQVIRARYPDGQHDAEALFRMPNGDLYIVTKGRKTPIALYRVPQSREADDITLLERVRQLAPRPMDPRDWVTAATASADGKWIAVRTYRTLWFYRADELLGAGEPTPITVDLAPLHERQGESVAFARDGSVWLTSESENPLHQPTWSRLVCTL